MRLGLIAVMAGVIVAMAITGTRIPPAAAAPAPSTYLSDVQIDMGTVRKYADESDNYHLTWHGDGNLYGAFGDGWGFVRSNVTKRAIGVSRITGNPDSLKAVDTWEGDAQGQSCCWLPWNGKSWGMISTGANLHMWFTIGRPRAMGFNEARIATSRDNGKTWQKASWAFTPADKFLMPSFLQAGKGYSSPDLPAEVMNYVYSYHTRYVKHPNYVQAPGRLDLVRVPRGKVTDRASYQFFAGLNGSGAPIWTKDPNQRRPVLEKPYLLDAPPGVSWNPYLQRFIMVMGHLSTNSAANIGIGFYEARMPWGPWYKIKEQTSFAQGTIFFSHLPTKWMNADLTAWLGFTGPDKEGGQEWDALNVAKVRFVKAGGTGSPTYLGCFADIGGTNLGDPHDLGGFYFGSSQMTVALCNKTCNEKGFAFSGPRNGIHCFCGNSYGRYGTATNCTTPCAGDSTKICGGYSSNGVYRLP